MANRVVHRLTAEQLYEQYEVNNHGPFPKSNQIGAYGFGDSKTFQEIELRMPAEVQLTVELVQKVVGTWVNMNSANQEFVRASSKFMQYANPNETPFYQSLEARESNAERFVRALSALSRPSKHGNS